MALIAYMPTAACAVPGKAGRLPEAVGEPACIDRAGLEVRARQLVYGERPVAGAKAGAVAARRGAGCLVTGAEPHAPLSSSPLASALETDSGPAP